MAKIIENRQLNIFLEELKKKFDVFDVREDILPPKKYFLPPHEKTFSFDRKDGKVVFSLQKKQFIVFGVKPADLSAINQLDLIMEKSFSDFFYLQKRAKSIIIGLSERPLKSYSGGDLVLEKINSKQYRAIPLTKKGKKISEIWIFKDEKDPKVMIKAIPSTKKLKEIILDAEFLSDAVSWSWTHDQKVWDELAKICLGCGICTYVCPLCYCFSTDDRVCLDGEKCARFRQWDACTLPNFAKVTGGHNFHKTLKERYYNWFFHKFVRAYKEDGRPLCVACGRCQKYCPARIDIEVWLLKIIKDYEKYLLAPKN